MSRTDLMQKSHTGNLYLDGHVGMSHRASLAVHTEHIFRHEDMVITKTSSGSHTDMLCLAQSHRLALRVTQITLVCHTGIAESRRSHLVSHTDLT